MLVLVTLCVLVLLWWMSRPKNNPCGAPGPRPWPVIGSLHLIGGYETPFQAFTYLSKLYGDVFSIDLGTSRCIVVNNFKLIKEVLVSKGADFGGRPDFIRFHKLFGGDRNNCKYRTTYESFRRDVTGVRARRHLPRTLSLFVAVRFRVLEYSQQVPLRRSTDKYIRMLASIFVYAADRSTFRRFNLYFLKYRARFIHTYLAYRLDRRELELGILTKPKSNDFDPAPTTKYCRINRSIY